MLRVILFYFGLLLMTIGLLFPFFLAPPPSENARWGGSWWFRAGLLLAIGAAHWPGGL